MSEQQQIFSERQLERFREFDERRCKKQYHAHRQHDNHHECSYILGYIRCTKCKQWVHPDKPEGRKQILITKGGRRIHKDCPVRAMGGAQFTARPRHRKTKDKLRDACKRY